jgi:hypothetical protein
MWDFYFASTLKKLSFQIWFLVALGALGLVWMTLPLVSRIRRRGRLRAWAAEKGLAFGGSERGLRKHFPDFSFLIVRGFWATGCNMTRGEWRGRPLVAFDYRYRRIESIGRSFRLATYRFSVLALQGAPKEVKLTLGSAGPAIHGFVGNDYLGTMPDADFLALSGETRRQAEDAFNRRVADLLVREGSLPFEANLYPNGLASAHARDLMTVEEFERAANFLSDLLDAIPTEAAEQPASQLAGVA